MTTYPNWAAGDEISAAKLNAGQWHVIIKQSTETVTSSTTYQDDDELKVALEADATYLVIWGLAPGGIAAADIKTRYTTPSGATGLKLSAGPTLGSAGRENTAMVSAAHNFGTDREYGLADGAAIAAAAMEHALIVNGSVAGDFQLQWAQNASNATGTAVLAGSWVAYVRVA